MKRYFGAAITLTALMFASCQKEVSEEVGGTPGGGGGGGGGTTATKLTRMVVKEGTDSTVQTYDYNAANRLTGIHVTGISGGQPIDLHTALTRNASNIILKQKVTGNTLSSFFVDSIVMIPSYNAGAGRYTHAVSHVWIFGFEVIDSAVFNYDGSGKLISMINYTDDGTGYVEAFKSEYTYNGATLVSEKQYTYDDATSTYELDGTSTYTWDNKVNPLLFAADAAILGWSEYYPANNVLTENFVAADPADNYSDVRTYTYNGANKPLTGTTTVDGTTATISFTYQ